MGRAFLSFCLTKRSLQATISSSKAVMAKPKAKGNTAPTTRLREITLYLIHREVGRENPKFFFKNTASLSLRC